IRDSGEHRPLACSIRPLRRMHLRKQTQRSNQVRPSCRELQACAPPDPLSTTSQEDAKHKLMARIDKAVLLAAGRGTRMRELTADLPKPMIEVRGKPVLQHIVEGLRDAGVR